jgi:hypothetical protein
MIIKKCMRLIMFYETIDSRLKYKEIIISEGITFQLCQDLTKKSSNIMKIWWNFMKIKNFNSNFCGQN